jgi:hypothetical protein
MSPCNLSTESPRDGRKVCYGKQMRIAIDERGKVRRAPQYGGTISPALRRKNRKEGRSSTEVTKR